MKTFVLSFWWKSSVFCFLSGVFCCCSFLPSRYEKILLEPSCIEQLSCGESFVVSGPWREGEATGILTRQSLKSSAELQRISSEHGENKRPRNV